MRLTVFHQQHSFYPESCGLNRRRPIQPARCLKPCRSWKLPKSVNFVMRFPFALSAKIAGHIIKHKVKRTPRFAMVLQLEPLHTCNLTCTGCGRIREYSTNLKDMVPLEKCLEAAVQCEAP